MRRYGEAVRPDQSYRNRPGAYGVILHDGHLLLTEQSRPYHDIQLPGGGIDPGESPVQALHREVREETGWKISVGRRLGAFQRYTYMPEYNFWARKVCHVYLCRAVYRLDVPSEPFHSSLLTIPERAARILGNAGDRAFVAALLRGRTGP